MKSLIILLILLLSTLSLNAGVKFRIHPKGIIDKKGADVYYITVSPAGKLEPGTDVHIFWEVKESSFYYIDTPIRGYVLKKNVQRTNKKSSYGKIKSYGSQIFKLQKKKIAKLKENDVVKIIATASKYYKISRPYQGYIEKNNVKIMERSVLKKEAPVFDPQVKVIHSLKSEVRVKVKDSYLDYYEIDYPVSGYILKSAVDLDKNKKDGVLNNNAYVFQIKSKKKDKLLQDTKVRIKYPWKYDYEYELSQPLKGFVLKQDIDPRALGLRKVVVDLNTIESFENVKPQNAKVFMVANNYYAKKSGYQRLYQCHNDMKLLKEIMTKCIKIHPKHIYTNKDITLSQFITRFKKFITKLDRNDMVIITFSGHGKADGTLVMSDGYLLDQKTLKSLVNRYSNDTVIIIDAASRSKNVKPIKIIENQSGKYKKNTMRIYGALTPLDAREIEYEFNPFFKPLLTFYKNTLKIKEIEGNGYFTALISYFYAEYKFEDKENITFKYLMDYVINKGNQYIEFLVESGNILDSEGREAKSRLDQQPFIHPKWESLKFKDDFHTLALIQDWYDTEIGGDIGLFFPMGNFSNYVQTMGIYARFYLNYELRSITRKFFLSFQTSYIFIESSNPDSDNVRKDSTSHILGLTGGIKYEFVNWSPFSASVEAFAGGAVTMTFVEPFGTLEAQTILYLDFLFGGAVNFQFEISKNLFLTLPGRFIYITYPDLPLYGVSGSIGINYYF